MRGERYTSGLIWICLTPGKVSHHHKAALGKHVIVGISACMSTVLSFEIPHHTKLIFLPQALLSFMSFPTPFINNPLPLLCSVLPSSKGCGVQHDVRQTHLSPTLTLVFCPGSYLSGKQGSVFWYLLSPLRMLFAWHWASVSPVPQRPQSCKHLSVSLTQYYGIVYCKGLLEPSSALSQRLHNSRGEGGIESRLLLKGYCSRQALALSVFCSQGSGELQGKIFLVYCRRRRAAEHCCAEACSRAVSHCLCRSLWANSGVASALSWWTAWPGVLHNDREAREPWCISSFFFSPYQLGAAFVLLCSSEVPVKSHPCVPAAACQCKSLLRVPRSCWGDSEPLAELQRHQRALHVQFDLGYEGYIPSSLTNTSGWFSQTWDINV